MTAILFLVTIGYVGVCWAATGLCRAARRGDEMQDENANKESERW